MIDKIEILVNPSPYASMTENPPAVTLTAEE
jgi:hypothetical protein